MYVRKYASRILDAGPWILDPVCCSMELALLSIRHYGIASQCMNTGRVDVGQSVQVCKGSVVPQRVFSRRGSNGSCIRGALAGGALVLFPKHF